MAKKQTSRKCSQWGAKVLLGLVATGSFAIAFGEERIGQYVSGGSGAKSGCLDQFYRSEPPILVNEKLKIDSYALCYNGFNVMYSGTTKTPLWVAEYLSPSRLSQKIKREDSFHEEEKIELKHRAYLSDYRASGYDRGHMAPNADMPTKAAQFDSFSLANMVPQSPKNNQEVWRKLEEATRALVTKNQQDVYVVTGPLFTAKRLKTIGKNNVIVPSAVFKAIYIPKTGEIGAYYAPNNDTLQVKIVSICYLEEQLGMNLFPQLTAEQKRNTHKLPLSTTEVVKGKKIPFSTWDAESQCAVDIKADQVKEVQKQFKAVKANAASSIPDSSNTGTSEPKKPTADEAPQQEVGIIQQILTMLLQFILQLLK